MRSRTCSCSGGFAYVLLLAIVAMLGLATAAAVSIGSRAARQGAEAQLLVIGDEFERALQSYRSARGAGAPGAAPTILEDLLRDPRQPGTFRHLRQVYVDPLTGKAQWGIVRGPDGSIVGVHSLAEGEPIKQAGFDPGHAHFERARTYAEWVFKAMPALPRSSPPPAR